MKIRFLLPTLVMLFGFFTINAMSDRDVDRGVANIAEQFTAIMGPGAQRNSAYLNAARGFLRDAGTPYAMQRLKEFFPRAQAVPVQHPKVRSQAVAQAREEFQQRLARQATEKEARPSQRQAGPAVPRPAVQQSEQMQRALFSEEARRIATAYQAAGRAADAEKHRQEVLRRDLAERVRLIQLKPADQRTDQDRNDLAENTIAIHRGKVAFEQARVRQFDIELQAARKRTAGPFKTIEEQRSAERIVQYIESMRKKYQGVVDRELAPAGRQIDQSRARQQRDETSSSAAKGKEKQK